MESYFHYIFQGCLWYYNYNLELYNICALRLSCSYAFMIFLLVQFSNTYLPCFGHEWIQFAAFLKKASNLNFSAVQRMISISKCNNLNKDPIIVIWTGIYLYFFYKAPCGPNLVEIKYNKKECYALSIFDLFLNSILPRTLEKRGEANFLSHSLFYEI